MKVPHKIALIAGFASLFLTVFPAGKYLISQASAAELNRAILPPTPTPKPSLPPAPKPIQTLDNLQAKIRQRLSASEVQRGRIGVKIVSLATGKVIFENDAEKYFVPASNMKNFTIAAALEKLGPDFRFVTSVYAAAKPDAAGTINGDLRIFGRGDLSISTAFNNGDYYKGLDNLVDKIAAAGVKRIEGDLVGDESYFKGFAIPQTWEWNDLQWYDGAEISALPINNNSVDLTIKPGATGQQCIVSVLPQTPNLMPVTNTCRTTASGSRTLKVFKPLNRNLLEISGTMPVGDKGFVGYIALTHPADLFIAMLKQRLQIKGVTIAGQARVLPISLKLWGIEIAQLESPPFSVIAAQTMKPSQNMFAETILWELGEQLDWQASPDADSSTLGLNIVRKFLRQIGVADDAIIQYDGSGLSRHDQVTPSAVVVLYTYMAKQSRNAQVWSDSLTVGGVDGTLSKRFVGTAATGNIRGKTGTLDQVSALSGYLTTAGGEEVVVSIFVNGVAETHVRTSLIDDIVVQLAAFNGKID